jgi:hypothetical protein
MSQISTRWLFTISSQGNSQIHLVNELPLNMFFKQPINYPTSRWWPQHFFKQPIHALVIWPEFPQQCAGHHLVLKTPTWVCYGEVSHQLEESSVDPSLLRPYHSKVTLTDDTSCISCESGYRCVSIWLVSGLVYFVRTRELKRIIPIP